MPQITQQLRELANVRPAEKRKHAMRSNALVTAANLPATKAMLLAVLFFGSAALAGVQNQPSQPIEAFRGNFDGVRAVWGWFDRTTGELGICYDYPVCLSLPVPEERLTDTLLVADWDGDGRDEAGFLQELRPRRAVLRVFDVDPVELTLSGRLEVRTVEGSMPIAGDWDGDGTDSIGFFVPTSSLFLLRHDTSSETFDYLFSLSLPHPSAGLPVAVERDGLNDFVALSSIDFNEAVVCDPVTGLIRTQACRLATDIPRVAGWQDREAIVWGYDAPLAELRRICPLAAPDTDLELPPPDH